MKITVTEKNFESILSKLQKVCSKYIMLRSCRVYDTNMIEKREYRRSPIKIGTKFKEIRNKNGSYKRLMRIPEIYKFKAFIGVAKHSFRKEWEENTNSYNAKLYKEMKCLIHFDLGGGCALSICEGDKIEFLPFGAFYVYTDNKFTSLNGISSIYRNGFFPCEKIKDLEEEKKKREKEWEEEEQFWDDFNTCFDPDYISDALQDLRDDDLLDYCNKQFMDDFMSDEYDPIDDPDIYDSLNQYDPIDDDPIDNEEE